MEITGKVHCFFEQEEWRDIKGFEGLYQVSSMGNVKSLERQVRANTCGIRTLREKILSDCMNKSGYNLVVLCKNGKRINKMIHRLVAEAFIPNPNNVSEVNHKDENKRNNCVSNLEWCDRIYNANYGTGVERCAKKKWKPVEMMDNAHNVLKLFNSALEAEMETGINRKNISSVCLGKRKDAGGYLWRFVYGN